MARQAYSKPDSGSSSNSPIGFETDFHGYGIRNSDFVILLTCGQHFIHHLAPQTDLSDSAFLQREASSQIVSEAKDNMVALPGQFFYSTQIPEMPQKAA